MAPPKVTTTDINVIVNDTMLIAFILFLFIVIGGNHSRFCYYKYTTFLHLSKHCKQFIFILNNKFTSIHSFAL